MVAAPAPLYEKHASGRVRPINLRHDMAQVVELLRLAFGPGLDLEGGTVPADSMGSNRPLWLDLLLGPRRRVAPGFVWEEEGRIVGNASLLTTRIPGRFLVANVAVHPNFRRRGIARRLMDAVLDTVNAHNGRVVLLQVDHENRPAINLYNSLGFSSVGRMTSWDVRYSRLRQLPVAGSGRSPDRVSNELTLRPLRGDEWRAAYELDRQSVLPDLDWPQPVKRDYYQQSFRRWLGDLLNARRAETWVVADDQQRLLYGLITINSEWGQAHQLRLRVGPAGAGRLERHLLAKALRRLQYLARRTVRIEHPAADETTTALLEEANFLPRRTLMTMRYDL